MLEGELIENRVNINDKEGLDLYDENGYGKPLENELELALVEAVFLLKKDKLKVFSTKNNKRNFWKYDDFYRYASEKEPEFHQKFVVYSDLRERGYLVKTGFKFGAHFRVYERGVKLKRGPKAPHEHTKFVVHCVPVESAFSLPEMSRAVRLAQNIRATFLWAIVDRESDVTFYELKRLTP